MDVTYARSVLCARGTHVLTLMKTITPGVGIIVHYPLMLGKNSPCPTGIGHSV